MKKDKLFICKSCQVSSNQENLEGKSGGYYLYKNLLKNAEKSSVEIVKSGCLWTCGQPCTVSFLANNKYTYHFVNIPPLDENYHQALLEFGELYTDSENGYILPAKVPEILQEKLLVRIPAVNTYSS
ncbi:MAG: DUF1636 domain-containing protein [Cyanobacterium sp. T60_A2020_053]|nr:DUF1636 domain-containing protein [Cyanobacterium sp. T60_A2020_053]